MASQNAKSTPTLSEIEGKFLLAYIKNLKGKPEVNWKNLCKELDYEKVPSAQRYFLNLKGRYGIGTNSEGRDDAATNTEIIEPSTPRKRRAPTKKSQGSAKRPKKSQVSVNREKEAMGEFGDFDFGLNQDEV